MFFISILLFLLILIFLYSVNLSQSIFQPFCEMTQYISRSLYDNVKIESPTSSMATAINIYFKEKLFQSENNFYNEQKFILAKKHLGATKYGHSIVLMDTVFFDGFKYIRKDHYDSIKSSQRFRAVSESKEQYKHRMDSLSINYRRQDILRNIRHAIDESEQKKVFVELHLDKENRHVVMIAKHNEQLYAYDQNVFQSEYLPNTDLNLNEEESNRSDIQGF